MKTSNLLMAIGFGVVIASCTKPEANLLASIDETNLTERGTDCCCDITFTAGTGTVKLCSDAFIDPTSCGEACYSTFKSKTITVISTPHATQVCNATLKTYYLKNISQGSVSGNVRCSGAMSPMYFSLNPGSSFAFIPNQSCVQELTSCD